MSRPRVYEAREIAQGMREKFADRPVEFEQHVPHGWPPVLQNIGDSLAVAYGSDKWQDPGPEGERRVELYKHLAESRNRALVKPGLLRDFYTPNRAWPVRGPCVALVEVPMPREFAILGFFEEANLRLYTEGDDASPSFGHGADDGVVKITVGHGMLGASEILWSRVRRDAQDQPFLFVYTTRDGVLLLVVGERLDVEKDGIVG